MNYLEKERVWRLIRLHAGNYKAEVAGMGSRGARACKGSAHLRILKMTFDNGETGALTASLRDLRGGDIKWLYRKRRMIGKKWRTLVRKLLWGGEHGDEKVMRRYIRNQGRNPENYQKTHEGKHLELFPYQNKA
jgi:hypothetical protein